MNNENKALVKGAKQSSDALFHYTQDLATLKAILKSGCFLPSYCAQYGWDGTDFAIPAVCFCDIPYSRIEEHASFYGFYGLGMSKEWARRYKISPVYYVDSKSKMHNKVVYILRKIKEGKGVDELSYLLLFYVKKVCGLDVSFKNKEEKPVIDNKRKFYDEREWRYVPDIEYCRHILIDNYRAKRPVFDNSKVHKYKASFDASDIDYIFVKSESERKDIIKFLEKEVQKEAISLISKIDSIEHIRNNS